MYFLIFKQIFLKSQFRLSFLHTFILFPLKLILIQLIQLILILIFVLTSIRVCGLELSGGRAERDLQIKSPQRKCKLDGKMRLFEEKCQFEMNSANSDISQMLPGSIYLSQGPGEKIR